MAKRIYPGNYVNLLSAWSRTQTNWVSGQSQIISGPVGVVYMPGFLAYHYIAHAEVPLAAAGATTLPLIIASPDANKLSTARPDVNPGIVVPTGAVIVKVGARLTKDVNLTTGHSIKVASSLAAATGAITATAASSPALAASAGGRLPAGQASKGLFDAAVATSAPLTLSVYSVDATGTAAGGVISRDALPLADIPKVIAECVFLVPDEVPGEEMLGLQPSGINQTLAMNTI